jgi:hypothetical protein
MNRFTVFDAERADRTRRPWLKSRILPKSATDADGNSDELATWAVIFCRTSSKRRSGDTPLQPVIPNGFYLRPAGGFRPGTVSQPMLIGSCPSTRGSWFETDSMTRREPLAGSLKCCPQRPFRLPTHRQDTSRIEHLPRHAACFLPSKFISQLKPTTAAAVFHLREVLPRESCAVARERMVTILRSSRGSRRHKAVPIMPAWPSRKDVASRRSKGSPGRLR